MEAAPARNTAREHYEPLFVGRGEELAQLWELATKGRHVVVTASAGTGKSALLSVFYRALQSRESLYIFRVGDSRQFKAALVELEQTHARGVRDILVHEYFGVDLEIIWDSRADQTT